ncbi:putative ribonuclease H-like domain-containing protein [Tanacetum coccineum]
MIAKCCWKAVEKRFGGESSTKKTLRNLLKRNMKIHLLSSVMLNKPLIASKACESSKKSRQQEQEKLKKECAYGNIYFHSLVYHVIDLVDMDWIDQAEESEEEPKVVRKNDDSPIIEEWVSDDELMCCAFLYGKIEEEVYVCQPLGFEDLDFPDRVYKVEKALYRLHQALRAWYETLSTYMLDNGFLKRENWQALNLIKGTSDILLSLRSMIGSLMYLTSSRPDIMFTVCACTRYQVNPKISHLHAVKRIFSAKKNSGCQIPYEADTVAV